MRATGRRAALVAAFVGLLAALVSTSAAPSALVLDQLTSTVVASLGGTNSASSPASGTVSDGVRSTHAAAARTTGTDRAPASHAGGWAVAATLLLLAALALTVGVRRAATAARPALWRPAAAPRAPPALAAC
jgi:hypothetical protein